MKYEIAISNQHNCTNKNGHVFSFIKDKEKIKEIREEYPKMIYPLWECAHCGKITQSM